MEIDLNNARITLCNEYNSLVYVIQAIIDSGDVEIEEYYVKNLKERLRSLRMTIAGIACSYDEGNPDFKDIIDQLPYLLSLRV